jgi:hypothetical protein
MQLWIIVTHEGSGYSKEDKHQICTREKDVVAYVGDIVSGARHAMANEVELVSVHKIDTTRGTMERLEPALENLRLVLKPKE